MQGTIYPTVELVGTIRPSYNLTGSLSSTTVLTGSIVSTMILSGSVTLSEDYDYYEGEYEVSPDANASVTLLTSGKVLSDDVTVLKVPYYETSNLTGKTVFIASDPIIQM